MTDKLYTEKELQEFKEEIQKKEITPLGWEVIDGEKLLKMNVPESEFLVEGLIPSRAITILSGNPGAGKSWILLEIAKTVGPGGYLFNHPSFGAKEAKTLYIDEEASFSETRRRWKMLSPPIIPQVDFMNLQGFRIDNPIKRRGLLDLADWRSYKLIIFDSLRDLHSRNENDSQQAQEIMDYFKEFTKRGITVLISHHNRKESFLNSRDASQILRGSSAILAGIDCLLSLENIRISEGNLELLITQAKLREGKPVQPFKVNLLEEEGKMKWEYLGEVETEVRKLEKAKEAVVEFLKEGEKYREEIVQALIASFFSQRTIQRAISELKEKQRIQPRKVGKKIYYSVG